MTIGRIDKHKAAGICLAADLVDMHNSGAIVLDKWQAARNLVELYFGPLEDLKEGQQDG